MLDPSYRPRARIHSRLTFDEANILAINMYQADTLEQLLQRLEHLQRHTPDSCLGASLQSLQTKMRQLSPQEFQRLKADCPSRLKKDERKTLFPPNYELPSLDTIP